MKRHLLRLLLPLFAAAATFSVTALIYTNRDSEIRSAYAVWLSEGNEGTKAEFLSWVKDESRRQASDPTIVQVPTPDREEPAYNVWLSEGNEGTEATFFEWIREMSSTRASTGLAIAPPGTSASVDVGRPANNVAYNLWLSEGNSGTEASFLAWIKEMSRHNSDGASQPPDQPTPGGSTTDGGCNISEPIIEPTVWDQVRFESIHAVFDGTPHQIKATGAPDGVDIQYANNVATDIGVHRAFVRLYREDLGEKLMTATITITRSDIEGVAFHDATFVFNESNQNIQVSGNVPEGVNVEYTVGGEPFDGSINIGTFKITATLSGNNFNSLILEATMTIERADINDISFGDRSFTYNGDDRILVITGTLPSGTSVAYTNPDGSPFTGVSTPGVHHVTATITGPNHNTLILTATLTINKLNITGISFIEKSVVYDGEVHTIQVTGTLPETVLIKYAEGSVDGPEWTGAVEPGVYHIFAIMGGDFHNTLVLSTTLVITSGSLEQVTGLSLTEESIPSGPIGTTTVWLEWDAVENADHYMVHIHFTDGQHAMSLPVSGTILEIKRDIWDVVWRGNYNVTVVAMPKSGDPHMAQSIPSDSSSYYHDGRIAPPQNIRIDDGFLRWDRTPYAESYEIMTIRYTAAGDIFHIYRVNWVPSNNTSANNPQQAISAIKNHHNLPPGNYRFAVRASILSGVAVWHAGYASEPSEYTEMIWLD